MMTFRLLVVLIILALFAIAFSELAKRTGDSVDPGSPCDEWSNPDCPQPALPPAQKPIENS
ncbi:hypothetical protein [Pseudaminobacter sp. NGMCC 1.201702]|uniref:hypothetical protein n=1 Tax=Pseudaminobacter sp. NGMCC 1.201702 TaxID=3391825 RepID=UPI0039EE3B09